MSYTVTNQVHFLLRFGFGYKKVKDFKKQNKKNGVYRGKG